MNSASALSPRVFISYSHETDEHNDRVLRLANRLRGDGVDCRMDQDQSSPPEGWPRWMYDQIRLADVVLPVCTETYRRRFHDEEEPGRGFGVLWESGVIINDLYGRVSQGNDKYFPALLDSSAQHSIPLLLIGARRFRVDTEEGYEGLREFLLARATPPEAPPPALPPLPPLRRQPDFSYPSGVPPSPSSFVGREGEVAEIVEQLRNASTRLLTLTGSGGVGKSRLAYEVARAYLAVAHDGAFVVDLTEVIDPAHVAVAVAERLGVPETKGVPLLEALKEFVADREMLLVFDGFEHLPGAETVVTDLLSAGLDLKVLVTSQAPVGVDGERRREVTPLEHPDPRSLPAMGELAEVDAVKLFLDRARRVDAGFELTNENADAVAEICSRLDGLPLAIELAVGWLNAWSPTELLKRMDPLLPLLGPGPRDLPARQRTMRAAVGWSYDLLTARQRARLRRLAVFAGGFSPEAAERVGRLRSEPALAVMTDVRSLIERSLLRRSEESGGRTRYGMLGVIQEYAWERLQDIGEARQARRDHAAYFASLLEESSLTRRGVPDSTRLDQLEADHANVQAALRWAKESGHSVLGWRLATGYRKLWLLRGYPDDGRPWLEWALVTSAGQRHHWLADLLNGAATLAAAQGEFEQAARHFEVMLELPLDPASEAQTRFNLGNVRYDQLDFPAADELLGESLGMYREQNDDGGVAQVVLAQGVLAFDRGNYDAASELIEQCRRSLAAQGEETDPRMPPACLTQLARIAGAQGESGKAAQLFEESLEEKRRLGDRPAIAFSLLGLALALQEAGEREPAKAFLSQSLSLYRGIGDKRGVAYGLLAQARFARAEPSLEGRDLLVDALRRFGDLDDRRGIAEGLDLVADLETNEAPFRAAKYFGAAEALREAIDIPMPPGRRLERDRAVAVLREQLGTDALTAAWAEGRALGPKEAVVDALIRDLAVDVAPTRSLDSGFQGPGFQ